MIAHMRQAVELCWVVFVVVWIVAARSAKRTVSRPSGQIGYRVFWLVGFVLLFLSRPRPRGVPAITKVLLVNIDLAVAGLILAVAGLLLALWARAVLGGNWSGQITLKENHTLVQSGPYRFIRHPIYTAILLLFLGTALSDGTVGAFVAFPITAIGFVLKAKQEEALMQSTFPDAYPTYRERTKMLVPGVF